MDVPTYALMIMEDESTFRLESFPPDIAHDEERAKAYACELLDTAAEWATAFLLLRPPDAPPEYYHVQALLTDDRHSHGLHINVLVALLTSLHQHYLR